MAERHTPGVVKTLLGESQGTKSYVKGVAPLYRVKTLSGRSVTATLDHRFLTPNGWYRLRDLHVGALIAADDTEHEASEKEIARGSLVRYSSGFRQDDELPNPVEVVAQDISRRPHTIDDENNTWLAYDLPSTDNYQLRSVQCLYGEYHDSLESLEPTLWKLYRAQQSEHKTIQIDKHLRCPVSECGTSSFVDYSYPYILYRDFLGHYSPSKDEGRAVVRQQTERQALENSQGSVGGCASCLSYPYDTHFWDRIESICYVKHGQYYDLTVIDVHHYSANGLWHHNSGKTKALTHRCAHLVEQGVHPEQILLSTFTNRAAQEFRGRLSALISGEADQVLIGTLHSVSAKILRGYGEIAGFSPDYIIYDSRDSQSVVRKCARELGIQKETLTSGEIVARISRWKDSMVSADLALGSATSKTEQLIAEVYRRYQQHLSDQNAMDFGDLVMNCVRLLDGSSIVLDRLGIRHVLVDEYQDVNMAQFSLVNLLARKERNLVAVGDVDQAIYSFRGADHQFMCNFQQHYPDATVFSLGQNYRCSDTIVRGAERVISQNKNRIAHRIYTDNSPGEPIVETYAVNEIDEARVVVQQIQAILKHTTTSRSNIAVLYRTNPQSQPIEEQLLLAKLPYHVVGNRFFQRREILDVMSYLRIIHNPMDLVAWEDLLTKPVRKISTTASAAILAHSEATGMSICELLEDPETLPITARQKNSLNDIQGRLGRYRQLLTSTVLSEFISHIMRDAGISAYYAERESEETQVKGTSPVGNLKRLIALTVNNYHGIASERLGEFIQYATLMNSDEESNRDAIQLMTLHSAKGTEYSVVFLVGVEENILPHFRALNDPVDFAGSLEEERRLFYVGMTRAKQRLYISSARNRWTPTGREVISAPSRFLRDIPEELIVRWR